MQSNTKLRFSRRALLKASALSPLAAQLLPELRNVAYAQERVPKNFIMVYTYQGQWPDLWASGSGTGFQLGQTLRALEPFKSDLILTPGLNMRSAELNPPGDNMSGHPQGQIHSTTSHGPPPGQRVVDGGSNNAGGPSIDQAILQDLIAKNGGNKLTDIDSLQLAIMDSAFSPPSQMLGRVCYRAPRMQGGAAPPLSPIQDPNTAWYRLFDGFDATGGGGGGGSTPVQPGEPTPDQLRAAQRRLMLKYAKGQFNSVKSRVGDLYGAATADRLQAHADFLNDLESSLPAFDRPTGGGTGTVVQQPSGRNPMCNVPSRDSIPRKPMTASGWYPVLSENMPKLMQLGVACGRTRFVTIQIEDSGFPSVHGWHHDNRKDLTIPFHTDMGNKFADILGKLKAIPTADGKNMLYHSVVLWCGELASGWTHGTNGLNWMVAGQAGGAWEGKTGRLVRFDGQPHTRLFLAIARAMGATLSTFGDPRVSPMTPLEL